MMRTRRERVESGTAAQPFSALPRRHPGNRDPRPAGACCRPARPGRTAEPAGAAARRGRRFHHARRRAHQAARPRRAGTHARSVKGAALTTPAAATPGMRCLPSSTAGRSVAAAGSATATAGCWRAASPDSVDINRQLVRSGWAVAYGDFGDEERAAREAGAGLWAGTFDRPKDWRARHGGMAEGEHALLATIVNWLRQVLRF